MSDALDALARAAGVPDDHPVLARERPFLAWWAEHLLDPRDPQRPRWLALELDQIARNRSLAAEVTELCALDGAEALDVGCQLGALPVALGERGARVTGVDVDDALLDGARRRCDCYGAAASFVKARAEALPFPTASFDVVTFVDVIEHVEDALSAVRELARVLRPGGVLYLFGPNRLSPANLRADPHYRLAGVSAMPHALGRWYVTKVRGFPRYDVGVLPVGARVSRWLRDDGLTLVRSPADDAARWWKSRAPAWAGAATPAARLWGKGRESFASLFRLAAAKPLVP
ncbi:MAG: class I SAM-dependent methyltransferase [Polyangiales bacterium]